MLWPWPWSWSRSGTNKEAPMHRAECLSKRAPILTLPSTTTDATLSNNLAPWYAVSFNGRFGESDSAHSLPTAAAVSSATSSGSRLILRVGSLAAHAPTTSCSGMRSSLVQVCSSIELRD